MGHRSRFQIVLDGENVRNQINNPSIPTNMSSSATSPQYVPSLLKHTKLTTHRQKSTQSRSEDQVSSSPLGKGKAKATPDQSMDEDEDEEEDEEEDDAEEEEDDDLEEVRRSYLFSLISIHSAPHRTTSKRSTHPRFFHLVDALVA